MHLKSRHVLKGTAIVALALLFASCARAPHRPPVSDRRESVHRGTIRHTVAPGETVWRLAKMYDVTTEDIMRANRLSRSQELRTGDRVTVPGAAPMQHVVPLFPSDKWRYIIIHHSATDEGNSLHFNKAHLKRGWDRGVGYHFVIDNGTMGKGEGQIEATPRWVKQQDGAHCKASDMNTKAIGVCLVGNFSRERVSSRQMDSLVFLLNKLRGYYRVPVKRIMGHGQVPGAATECPGTRFPWSELKRRLRQVARLQGHQVTKTQGHRVTRRLFRSLRVPEGAAGQSLL